MSWVHHVATPLVSWHGKHYFHDFISGFVGIYFKSFSLIKSGFRAFQVYFRGQILLSCTVIVHCKVLDSGLCKVPTLRWPVFRAFHTVNSRKCPIKSVHFQHLQFCTLLWWAFYMILCVFCSGFGPKQGTCMEKVWIQRFTVHFNSAWQELSGFILGISEICWALCDIT